MKQVQKIDPAAKRARIKIKITKPDGSTVVFDAISPTDDRSARQLERLVSIFGGRIIEDRR